MPWHDVQFLRITCQTGPDGGTTCGRDALRPCAATVLVTVVTHATVRAKTTAQIAALWNLPIMPIQVEVRCFGRCCRVRCRRDGECSAAYWMSSVCRPGTRCACFP